MGLVNVDIDLLRTLIAIGETGSFTAAGERLFRTQSAISLQVKRLEQLTGQALFDRGKEIKLTRAGEMVRSYATEILKLNDAMLRDVGTEGEEQVLKIGTPDDYAQLFLPSIIREFSRSNSNIEFQIRSDLSVNLSNLVDAGEIDIAFITWNKGISGINLVKEPLSWVSVSESLTPSEDPLPLAVFPDGCRLRDMAMAALDAKGRKWRVAYSSNQFAPLRAAISAGAAIGVLPTRAVPRDLMRVGSEYDLPELPAAELIIKLRPQAPESAHRLASAIANALRPGAFGTA
jgi:DNA-binding transcriptional LysR family regulator